MALPKGLKIAMGVVGIVLLIILFFAVLRIGVYTIDKLPDGTPGTGVTIQIDAPWIANGFSWLFQTEVLDWGTAVLMLMVLMILIAGTGDILVSFTTFSTPVSWIIASGIGVAFSVIGLVNAAAAWVGAVGTISGLAIGFIVIAGLVGAVSMNFLMTWSGLALWGQRKETNENRKKFLDNFKSMVGTAAGMRKATEEGNVETT